MKLEHLTVYEHETVKLQGTRVTLSPNQLKAMVDFYGDGQPYYSLVHCGVKFCEYVGVIQIGNIIIEVLPKADIHLQENSWRKILIDMIKYVGVFDIHAPSSSTLDLKPNAILELYFEIFISEVEMLIRRGLIKKYRKFESNQNSLRGSIQFNKHLSKNFIHKERFYVSHTVYDGEHQLHMVLNKALNVIRGLNTSENLLSRIEILRLDFPEMPDIKVTEDLFSCLSLGRKESPYQKAIKISEMILCNFHPNLTKGGRNVLALMFDMNLLWEQIILKTIKRQSKQKKLNLTISGQVEKAFWRPDKGQARNIKPDILVKGELLNVVLDTKWKNLQGLKPDIADLKQMYVYHDFYDAKKVALIYPASQNWVKSGTYQVQGNEKSCSLIGIPVNSNLIEWEKAIFEVFIGWYEGGV